MEREPYQTVKWRVRRTPAGDYEGVIRIPGRFTATTVRAVAPTKKDALLQATGLAQEIADNPIVSALLPPGSKLALDTATKLASAAKVGKLAEAAASVVGPGAKRLAKALKFW